MGVMGMMSKSRKNYLPIDFVPSDYDVICGRGKDCYNHSGNRRFRVTIDMSLHTYTTADTKLQKSLIVMSIVDMFRSNSQGGGFVRQDRSSGRWYEIGDEAAREKVGQTIREALVQQDPEKRAQKRMKRAMNKAKKNAREQPFRTKATSCSQEITQADETLASVPPQLVLESSRDWFTPPSGNDSDSSEDVSVDEDDFDSLFDTKPVKPTSTSLPSAAFGLIGV